MTLTFSNKELQKKGGSEVAAALDKEQQRVGGNLQVKACLCTKSVAVRTVCTVACKVTKGRNEMDVSGDPSFIPYFSDGKHDSIRL